jgi:hypothetical protein
VRALVEGGDVLRHVRLYEVVEEIAGARGGDNGEGRRPRQVVAYGIVPRVRRAFEGVSLVALQSSEQAIVVSVRADPEPRDLLILEETA